MQNSLTKQDVINIIKEFNTTQGGTVSGFTVPKHQHNGSDMIKVLMGDLAYDNRGINFPMISGNAQMVIINGDTLATSGSASTAFNQVRIIFDDILTYTGLVGTLVVGDTITRGTKVGTIVSFTASTLTVRTTSVNPFTTGGFTTSGGATGTISAVNSYFTEVEEKVESTAIITTGPSWFMRLPNNSVLPPSPKVGDICIFNGFLQVCEVANVWTAK